MLAATELFQVLSGTEPGGSHVMIDGRFVSAHQADVLSLLAIGGPQSPYGVGGRLLSSGLHGSLYGGLVALGLRGALLAGPRVCGSTRVPIYIKVAPSLDSLADPWICGSSDGVISALGMAGKGGTVVLTIGGKTGAAPDAVDGWPVPVMGIAPPEQIGGFGDLEAKGGDVLVLGGTLESMGGLKALWPLCTPGTLVVTSWASPPVLHALRHAGLTGQWHGWLWQYGRQTDLAWDLAVVTGCGDWVPGPGDWGGMCSSGGRYLGVSVPVAGASRWAILGPGGKAAKRKARAQALRDGGTGYAGSIRSQRAASLVGGLVVLPVPGGTGYASDQAEVAKASVSLGRGVAAIRGGVVSGAEFWEWVASLDGDDSVSVGLRHVGLSHGWLKAIGLKVDRRYEVTAHAPKWMVASGLDDLVDRLSGLYSLLMSVQAVVSNRVPWYSDL